MIRLCIVAGLFYCAAMPAIAVLSGFGFVKGLAVSVLVLFVSAVSGVVFDFMEYASVDKNVVSALFFGLHIVNFLAGAGFCAFGGGL